MSDMEMSDDEDVARKTQIEMNVKIPTVHSGFMPRSISRATERQGSPSLGQTGPKRVGVTAYTTKKTTNPSININISQQAIESVKHAQEIIFQLE